MTMPAGTTNSTHLQLPGRGRVRESGKQKGVRQAAVLIAVDDDEAVLRQLAAAATAQAIELEICQDPVDALLLIGRMYPDAIILGPISGPVQDVDILAAIRRADPELPVVVGVGADEAERVAQANAAGATAIVPRPYRVAQLLTLLSSLSMSAPDADGRPPVLAFGPLRIDSVIPQIWLRGEHMEVPLREFLLLRYLAERAGTVVGRDELEAALWGEPGTASSNSLTVHIMRLRRRLGDDESSHDWIRVTRGFGYRFQVPDAESGSPTVH